MKEDNDILKTIGRSDGMTVPDGYFADFAELMAGQLPQRPELAAMNVVAPPASLWGKLRPYVYMAAMFAGVWCMLKIFTTVSGPQQLAPMDKNPVMAKAFGSDEFFSDYVLDDVSSNDVIDDIMDEGIDLDSLMLDFE